MYENICLENIKKLYKPSGKFNNQKNYKAILGAAMISTPEVFTNNSTMPHRQYMNVKNSVCF